MQLPPDDKNQQNQSTQQQSVIQPANNTEHQQNTQGKDEGNGQDVDLYREEHGDLTNDNT